MILYYTYKQKTKIFAQALGEVLSLPTEELTSDLNQHTGFAFLWRALKLTFTGKSHPVSNMPQHLPDQIYVCSPIWGGKMAAPVKYFLENANLQNVKVNLLLTASIPTLKYRENALKFLRNLPCIPGVALIFATTEKVKPEQEVLAEQLRDILKTNSEAISGSVAEMDSGIEDE